MIETVKRRRATTREIVSLVFLYRVRVVRKEDSRLMRLIGHIAGEWFRRHAWTALRFPFCRPVIYVPPSAGLFDVAELGILVDRYRGVTLCSAKYLWPWPKALARRWFADRLSELGL